MPENHDFLRARRSIRRFTEEAVPDSVIERILITATHAPSAHNRQPWRFFVATSAVTKACLAEAMAAEFQRDLAADGLAAEQIEAQIERSRKRILGAPVVVLLSMEMSDMDRYPDVRRSNAERTMAQQSVAAAGLQLLLAARAEGLGGVWICSPLFAPGAAKKALDLPATWEPQAMYFLGYPDDEPKPKALKPIGEVAIFDH
jgi:coenzyme F420-0:L-glutamate ligase/coenzyme F420-1:gamma-L-glutamate ligase